MQNDSIFTEKIPAAAMTRRLAAAARGIARTRPPPEALGQRYLRACLRATRAQPRRCRAKARPRLRIERSAEPTTTSVASSATHQLCQLPPSPRHTSDSAKAGSKPRCAPNDSTASTEHDPRWRVLVRGARLAEQGCRTPRAVQEERCAHAQGSVSPRGAAGVGVTAARDSCSWS